MISKYVIGFLVVYATVFVMAAPIQKLIKVTPSEGQPELKPIMSSFNCTGRPHGYYTDMENDCKYFHFCYKVAQRDGSFSMSQATFKCPNDTVFNQKVLNCDWDLSSSDCGASDFDSNKIFTTPASFYPTTELGTTTSTTKAPAKRMQPWILYRGKDFDAPPSSIFLAINE